MKRAFGLGMAGLLALVFTSGCDRLDLGDTFGSGAAIDVNSSSEPDVASSEWIAAQYTDVLNRSKRGELRSVSGRDSTGANVLGFFDGNTLRKIIRGGNPYQEYVYSPTGQLIFALDMTTRTDGIREETRGYFHRGGMFRMLKKFNGGANQSQPVTPEIASAISGDSARYAGVLGVSTAPGTFVPAATQPAAAECSDCNFAGTRCNASGRCEMNPTATWRAETMQLTMQDAPQGTTVQVCIRQTRTTQFYCSTAQRAPGRSGKFYNFIPQAQRSSINIRSTDLVTGSGIDIQLWVNGQQSTTRFAASYSSIKPGPKLFDGGLVFKTNNAMFPHLTIKLVNTGG
ncbi:MAG: hypothetical protein R3B07_07405 [Polyangiaceae bacterium]